MQLSPFRFDLGDLVRPADDIRIDARKPASPQNNIIVPKEARGTINAMTVSRKGVHVSVTFKSIDRTLLLNQNQVVHA